VPLNWNFPAILGPRNRKQVNPFVVPSWLVLGPFKPGDHVKHYVDTWFTGNTQNISLVGLGFLVISVDFIGPYISGTIPLATPAATYYGTVKADNPKGSASVDFQVIVN
jgi:hypothetical protein